MDELIKSFLNFHFRMLYLFCLSNNYSKFEPEKNIYRENNLFNSPYLYNLIEQHDMLDDIIYFYDEKDTFILNSTQISIRF